MRWSATPSAGRSAATRRSSTSWPTSTSRTSWPAPTPTTAPGRWTTGAAELPLAAASARVAASEAFWYAAKENLQTHGGMGFTWADRLPPVLPPLPAARPRRRRRQGLERAAGAASSNVATPPRLESEGHGLQRHARRSRLPRRGARLARRQRAQGARATERRRGSAPSAEGSAKAWQAKKAAAGYACITWPKEWGGGGGANSQAQVIFGQEEANFADARQSVPASASACACRRSWPSATRTTKQRFVGPAMRGEEIWCQLFSEPVGRLRRRRPRAPAPSRADGSATGSSTARRSGPRGAHYSDFGILITRTDPDVPKHKGLTMFWVDMHDAGHRGAADPPDVGRLGLQRGLFHRRAGEGQPARSARSDDGWRVSLVTLMNERIAIGGGASYHRQVMDLASSIATLAGSGDQGRGPPRKARRTGTSRPRA